MEKTNRTQYLSFEGESSSNFPQQKGTVNAAFIYATQPWKWKVQKTAIQEDKSLRVIITHSKNIGTYALNQTLGNVFILVAV